MPQPSIGFQSLAPLSSRLLLDMPFTFQASATQLIYLCMYLAVPGLLVAAGIFDLHCNMQGLGCSMWNLVPREEIQPGPPALGAHNLSQWTTREVQYCDIIDKAMPFPRREKFLLFLRMVTSRKRTLYSR